ncbi:hypothetical protein F4819DRAFT_435924 [Hypoxylon fuscum]|nr:hypothetical protein F4819DRAFT_435924 [Hypoxylon fuscum]
MAKQEAEPPVPLCSHCGRLVTWTQDCVSGAPDPEAKRPEDSAINDLRDIEFALGSNLESAESLAITDSKIKNIYYWRDLKSNHIVMGTSNNPMPGWVADVTDEICEPKSVDDYAHIVALSAKILKARKTGRATGLKGDDAAAEARFSDSHAGLTGVRWSDFNETMLQTQLYEVFDLKFSPTKAPLWCSMNQSWFAHILSPFPYSQLLANPHPDGLYGFTTAIYPAETKLTRDQIEFRELLAVNNGGVHFPYLVVEVNNEEGSLEEPRKQCIGACALSLRLTNSLIKGDNFIFGLLMTESWVEILVMWHAQDGASEQAPSNANGGEVTGMFILRTVDVHNIRTPLGVWMVQDFVRNLHRWALETRFPKLKTELAKFFAPA